MRDEAETIRVLDSVEPPEQGVLQGLERDILSVLSTNQMEGHATWVNQIDAAKARFVQLWLATDLQSTCLLEWSSSKLAAHSLDKLRAHLKSSGGNANPQGGGSNKIVVCRCEKVSVLHRTVRAVPGMSVCNPY